jgi:hypothetical protein
MELGMKKKALQDQTQETILPIPYSQHQRQSGWGCGYRLWPISDVEALTRQMKAAVFLSVG